MNLFNTTVFRLSLSFAIGFAALAAVSMLSVYQVTFNEMDSQANMSLLHELGEIEVLYYQDGLPALIQAVKDKETYGHHLFHYYSWISNDKTRVEGNQTIARIVTEEYEPGSEVKTIYAKSVMDDAKEPAILSIVITMLDDSSIIAVAHAKNSLVELKNNAFTMVIAAVLTAFVISVLIGYNMGKVVLKRINRIDQGLEAAIASDFKTKLPVPDHVDEFQALALKLNMMLSRIEGLIASIRQVTDNVAHDLRSPVARLRSRLEVTLLQSRSVEEYRDAMEHAVEDCDSLLTTFNALLSIARAEAGVRSNDWSKIDLSVLCDDLAELYQAVAEDRELTLGWSKPDSIFVEGNRQLLSQAVSNLLDNAIKFSPEQGKVDLRLFLENGKPVICVCDNGRGIPTEDRERVLERFERLDSARSSPGSGLGLSLVTAVANLHHAKLTLGDNSPGLCAKLVF